jgi:hypothetical protein
MFMMTMATKMIEKDDKKFNDSTDLYIIEKEYKNFLRKDESDPWSFGAQNPSATIPTPRIPMRRSSPPDFNEPTTQAPDGARTGVQRAAEEQRSMPDFSGSSPIAREDWKEVSEQLGLRAGRQRQRQDDEQET